MFPFVRSIRLDLDSWFQDTKIRNKLTRTKRPDIFWARSPLPAENHHWTRKVAKFEQRVSKFKIDTNIIGFLNLLIRILDEKSIKKSISKSNVEQLRLIGTSKTAYKLIKTMKQKLLFKPKTSMKCRSRKKTEFQSHERNHLFDYYHYRNL